MPDALLAWLANPLVLLALALPVAWAVDRWWGEPPVALHPVVWMGHYLGMLGGWIAPRVTKGQPLSHPLSLPNLLRGAGGALAWCVGALGVALLASLLQSWVLGWDGAWVWLAPLVLGLLLKPLLAWRMLRDEVQAVEDALARSLDEGRAQLARLVSRDVTQLDATQVRESAIESLTENLNDSLVAPVFWFFVLGLPGAALYRFANTADAMWGYPGERGGRDWHWAGKWAARADDVLSWIPARLTALLLWLCGPASRRAMTARALRVEARKTPSPNSGWPMAAAALLLDLRLAKPGVYVLNPDGQAAQPAHTRMALDLCRKTALSAILCAVLAMVLIAFWIQGMLL